MTAYITGGTRGLKIGFNVTAVTRNVFSEEKETETRGQVIFPRWRRHEGEERWVARISGIACA